MGPIIVLLVEDDASIALVVKTLLTRNGYEVHQCTNAEDALKSCEHIGPGLLMTDLHLKGQTDGLALIDRMRQNFSALPAILVSGDFTEGGNLDAGDAIIRLGKPFRAATMLAALARAQKKPV
ncbi:MAG: response regulator [Acetobacteraceae bacterium]